MELKRIHDNNAFLPDLCGLTNLWPGIVAFARAVERAHGIAALAAAKEQP